MENEFYEVIGKLLKHKKELEFELRETQKRVRELEEEISEFFS